MEKNHLNEESCNAVLNENKSEGLEEDATYRTDMDLQETTKQDVADETFQEEIDLNKDTIRFEDTMINEKQDTKNSSRKHNFPRKAVVTTVIVVLLLISAVTAFLILRPRYLYSKGVEKLVEEDYEEAISLFQSAKNYSDADKKIEYAQKGINLREGMAALERKDYGVALNCFEQALGLHVFTNSY